MGNNKKNNFILQAGILAAAGFISRIIGLLYVSPVAAIIGTVGLGYYSSAYTYYTIILLISSYSIPSAISKVIAQKLSLKEYKNAHRIFVCSMYYVLGVGLAASLLLYFGASLFVEDSAIPVLRVFAPTIFLYGILGVLRGYFQAHKSMVQTSISQILEQIVNAIVSIVAAYGFVQLAEKKVGEAITGAAGTAGGAGVISGIEAGTAGLGTVTESAAVLENSKAIYGAMGSALGTGAGVLFALLFMAGIYALNRGFFRKRIKRDRTEHLDSYMDISRTIAGVVLPFILSTAAYNLSASLNNKLYTSIMIYSKGVEEALVHNDYGIFGGEAMKISNIPIAFASAMAAAIIPTVSQLIARKELEDSKVKIAQAVKTIMVVSIPSAVGLFVLAKPIIKLLFPSTEANMDLAAKTLMALAVSVVFYALSTLSSSILQGIGRVNAPIINAVIALILQTAVLVPLLLFTDFNIYALVIASTVYSLAMCILNQISVRKALGYGQEVMRTMVIPALAAIFMGGLAWAAYQGVYMLTKSNIISLAPAIVLAVAAYFALLILFRGMTESELRAMPKGHLLVKIAKRCRLMR